MTVLAASSSAGSARDAAADRARTNAAISDCAPVRFTTITSTWENERESRADEEERQGDCTINYDTPRRCRQASDHPEGALT
jgi:hypothetical protein